MLSRYIIFFMIMAFLGWIYETIAMTLFNRKWDNRGFLYMPIIPIYGVGSVLCLIVITLYPDLTYLQIFLLGLFGSVVLEIVTAYTLDKLFHAYWWDYSNVPLNFKGWVSLPTACGFGLGALLICKVLCPLIFPLVEAIPSIIAEILSIIIIILVTADTTLTVSILTNFNRKIEAIDEMLNEKMDGVIEDIKGFTDKNLETISKSMSYTYHGAIKRVKGFSNRVGSSRVGKLATRVKDLTNERFKDLKNKKD